MTMNTFGLGKAIYIGTMSHQHFYYDLIVWLRQLCNLYPLLKVPDTVEVSLRQKGRHPDLFLLIHRIHPCASSSTSRCTTSFTGPLCRGT